MSGYFGSTLLLTCCLKSAGMGQLKSEVKERCSFGEGEGDGKTRLHLSNLLLIFIFLSAEPGSLSTVFC